MNKLNIFILLIFIIFSACGSLKDGFTNQKKNNSDEFLVEKKSPLIMPPDFNELPIPKTNQNKNELKENEIKKLITNNKKMKPKNKKNISQNLEESLLDKIKKD